mmetsp:Transcript_82948/g.230399  ORF Transcript_82948/g.230399 Transcript_82948/m.230399 type:complete len:280 (+) Transcript_82948:80-919(+)
MAWCGTEVASSVHACNGCKRIVILTGLTSLGLACLILITTGTAILQSRAAHVMHGLNLHRRRHDLLIVLAGGVDESGRPLCAVHERLLVAARMLPQRNGSSTLDLPAVLMNGGGMAWKPRFTDVNGFAVPEAALMARELANMSEIPTENMYLEGFSEDTIGNAFFARTMHADLRPDWQRILVITSRFHMARARAIYRWIFSLKPLPSKGRYELEFREANDSCVEARALARRRRQEADSLKKFREGSLPKMRTLSQVHRFLYQRHGGYSLKGILGRTGAY